MKRLAILGSTGSIGTNCVEVVVAHPDQFEVRYLSTHRNVDLLVEQAARFRPRAVAVYEETAATSAGEKFRQLGVELYTGLDGIVEISRQGDYDILVNALVGSVGLRPTLNALQRGRRVALANKETLVMGGALVMDAARAAGAELIPIDSEHSALLQCLAGEDSRQVETIILTASGGPFKDVPAKEFSALTVEQALRHPNWDMGQKITIDSATLMNKGLEVIEARWLFDLPADRIQVVVHPESIIHSMVEFVDGSVKAQMGVPDMRVPIQYALSYPGRVAGDVPRMDFRTLRKLTFEPPDLNKFRCLHLAYEAIREGGAAPAVLNAANEEAVHLFLNRRIGFHHIPGLVEEALSGIEPSSGSSLDELLHYDQSARAFVRQQVQTTF